MNESRFFEVVLGVFLGLWLFALSLVLVLKLTDTDTTLYSPRHRRARLARSDALPIPRLANPTRW